VTSELGEGSFGTVYEGVSSRKNIKKVAIKTFEEDSEKAQYSWAAEKRIASQALDHENVVKFVATGENYIITELAENGTFFAYLNAVKKLEEKCARKFFWDLINGLDYIHSKGIVHGDLKPENLLLDSKFKLKIADFGASKLIGTEEIFNIMTSEYMAPEFTKT